MSIESTAVQTTWPTADFYHMVEHVAEVASCFVLLPVLPRCESSAIFGLLGGCSPHCTQVVQHHLVLLAFAVLDIAGTIIVLGEVIPFEGVLGEVSALHGAPRVALRVYAIDNSTKGLSNPVLPMLLHSIFSQVALY